MKFPAIPAPKPGLERDPIECAILLKKAQSLNDVADILEVHPGHLKHWLYNSPGHAGYHKFEIPKKSGGTRVIKSPPQAISILQSKLKCILECIYEPKSCVAAFVKNRSIVYGAKQHNSRSKWILNFDIKDFYDSINFGRVIGLFKALGIGHNAAAVLSHLVTCDKKLPQGSCVSPIIANMICYKLDNKMIVLCKRFKLRYSRYADDISLSTTKNSLPKEIASYTITGLLAENIELGKSLLDIISQSGFVVNSDKTRVYSRYVRQEITGLTVNQFVNVKSTFYRNVRAMIHAVKVYGVQSAAIEYFGKYSSRIVEDKYKKSVFLSILYGKLSFYKMVCGSNVRYGKMCVEICKHDPNPPKSIKETSKMYEEFDVFICHASEDKKHVAKPLDVELGKIGVKSFLDANYIKWGDSFVEKINHAMSKAKIVLVVLSVNSVDKAWPKKEVNSAIAREIEGSVKVLPLLVGDKDDIKELSKKLPLLADKLYKTWENNPSELAIEIKELIL